MSLGPLLISVIVLLSCKFLQDPSKYPTHERMMPDLNITEKEAMGLVAFLKHMSSIDTNGFPRNFARMSTDGVTGAIHGK